MDLIVRADDAGLCEGVNRAVVETVLDGIVRNVSVMAPAPAFEDAAHRLRALPGLCVGLHATLTSEWTRPRWRPVLPPELVRSLVDDDGYFLPSTVDLHHRQPVLSEAVSEIHAQLGRARAAGLPIAYLDEHMGVGWLPGLRNGLVMLARRENLVPAEQFDALPPKPISRDAGRALLRQLGGRHTGTRVLISHPGHDEPELRAMHLPAGRPGEVAAERDAERRALISPAAHRLAARSTLLRYSDVYAQRTSA